MAADSLHITLANYEAPPNAGGGGEFTASLGDRLDERHTVERVTGSRDGQTSELGDMLAWPARRGPDLWRAANRSDILNTHFSVPTSVLSPILSRQTPVVVNLMGADVFDPTRYQRVRPLLDVINKWVRLGADRFIVPSADMYDRLSTSSQAMTDVVPYFVDTDRYCPGDSHKRRHKPFRLLTVSRLVERKQLHLAIDALEYLQALGVDCTLTIAGTGPERDWLETLTADADVADSVTFTGYVDEADLPDLYREHDCYLMPSAHEAFGISCAEALASGLPAVVTDTGGHAELVGGGGLVTSPTSKDIADAIQGIRHQYRDFCTAARERAVEHYSPAAVIPQYERIYEEVLDGR